MTAVPVSAPAHPGRTLHLVLYAILLASAVIALPVLGLLGARTLLESRDGEVIDPVLDPALPGYQALVSPSPTLAAVHLDPDGTLVGVSVMALAGEDVDGGSVLVIPPRLLVSVPELGDFTLEYIQQLNGTENTLSLVEFVLGLGIDDVVEISHDGWAELVAPLGGLTFTNPDELVGADGAVRFEAGEITLAPEDLGPYLAALRPDESPLNQVLRHELVWRAYLAAVRRAPEPVRFGGEQDRGLARFVPAIAGGTSRIAVIPLEPPPVLPDPAEAVTFTPDLAAVARLVPQLVPFPAGARPGDRPLVRVLDGSARYELIPSVVRHVAIAGGQVVMIGNTDEFGVEATQVLVADPDLVDFARSVAEALGVGSVQRVDYIDENAEVIVVLGGDYQP